MATSKETTATPTTSTKPCYFFKLPSELRLAIYDAVFSTTRLYGRADDRKSFDPAMLFTCSQIYDEASAAFNRQLDAVESHARENVNLAVGLLMILTDHLNACAAQGIDVDMHEIDKLEDRNTKRKDMAMAVLDLAIQRRRQLGRFYAARVEGLREQKNRMNENQKASIDGGTRL